MNAKLYSFVLALALLAGARSAMAQGTAFTYQGLLQDNGSPANGNYDLRLRLFDAVTNGDLIAGPLTNLDTPVTNGLFITTIDFGNVFDGTNLWLQISVRTNGAANFILLDPRQPLTPAPYAIFAEGANAAGLTGTIPMASLSGTYGGAVSLTNAGNSFTGNGAGLTNVNATAVGGVALSNFWQLGGNNAGSGAFIGTTNNQVMDIRVNNVRALRFRLTADAAGVFSNAPNVILGSPNNVVSANASVGAVGGTIAGGGGNDMSGNAYPNLVMGDFGTVGGGIGNTASGPGAVIGGGGYDGDNMGSNYATGGGSVIGGGLYNLASGSEATVGGGYGIEASGDFSTAGGGYGSTASGEYSTVAGGYGNEVSGEYSTVAGGNENNVTAPYGTVGGGSDNSANGTSYGYSTVAGGQNNTSGSYSTVGGGISNSATGFGSFIGGGGYATGMYGGNQATAGGAVIGGGVGNLANGICAFIGGGGYDGTDFVGNTAGGDAAVVAGGIGNTASGSEATVGGGDYNDAVGGAATVPGGAFNYAAGEVSFAAGFNATANFDGSFVWSDGTGTLTQDTGHNQFVVRASSGFFFYTDTGSDGVHLDPNATSWTTLSDRNAKKGIEAEDCRAVLDKLAQVPVDRWRYKWESDSDTPHIGPMAQDFKHAFYPGRDDKGITTLEFDGVELAAIQGLNQKLNEKDAEIQELKKSVSELKRLMQALAEKKEVRLADKKLPPGQVQGDAMR